MRRDTSVIPETTLAGEAPAGAPAAASVVAPVPAALAPVRPDARIESLDVLRGIALLGIVLVNVYSFALPVAAARHPAAYGDPGGANGVAWLVNFVLIDGKMRAIFCMLFGASVILLTGRAERRARGAATAAAGLDVADIYHRRMLWLAALGALHGYLIWHGDILFHFGVIGLALFPLRKLSGRTLCVLGLCLLLLHSVHVLRGARSFRRSLATVAAHDAGAHGGVVVSSRTLTEQQQQQLRDARDSVNDFAPSAASVAEETEVARGGYLDSLARRARVTAAMHSQIFYRSLLFDIGGAVLLGMGLMKLEVFDASRSTHVYAWMVALGYGVALPVKLALATMWAREGFDLASMFAYARLPNDALRIGIAAGHIGVIMLICKAGLMWRFRRAMSRVGRMALSCYVLTSILCSLLFYGYGLGMFARFERYQLLYVAGGVWIVLILFCGAWLARFRFGPLEWLWRSLTYAQWQPMRLQPAGSRGDEAG